MLTYQLQRRRFALDAGVTLSFPANVEIEFALEPEVPFGAINGPSRTAVHERKASMLWNANNGACSVQSDISIAPVTATGRVGDVDYQFVGSRLFFRFSCPDAKTLYQRLQSLHGLIPSFLGLVLFDVPTIKFCRGKVGDSAFRWEMVDAHSLMQLTNDAHQNTVLQKAMDLFAHMSQTRNLRFIAALNYFVRACRLMLSGNGPWEFMAETVLNLAKCLEVLAVAEGAEGSRDKVRAGLKALGVPTEKIEGTFVPVLILRNSFDVGHGRIASLANIADLQLVYEFLWAAETEFRDMLKSVADGLVAGSVALPEHFESDEYDKSMQGVIDRLRAKQDNKKP